MNDTFALVSVLLLLAVGALGAVDALYFHLWKFRLFAHPQSRREHLTHTLRALLAGPTVALLFAWPATGARLWLVGALIVADFAIMLWDLFEEPDSRCEWGGIPPVEYALHVVAGSLHAAGYALALASRPGWAWALDAPPLTSSAFVGTVVTAVWPLAVALGLVHVALMHPRWREALAQHPRNRAFLKSG